MIRRNTHDAVPLSAPSGRNLRDDGERRISVLHVIGSLDVGGAERHLVRVLPELAKRRYDPKVFCLTSRGVLATELESNGVGVATVNRGRGRSLFGRFAGLVRAALGLARYIRQQRPEIVSFYLPAAYLVGAPVSLIVGPRRRVMWRRSRNFYQSGRPVAAFLERLLHRRMTALVANSEAVRADLSREGAPLDRISVIHNGVDLDDIRPTRSREAVRAELGLPMSSLVFVMVANLIAYKGHCDLIEAFSAAGLRPDSMLVLVGRDQGIRTGLETLASERGVEGRIIFLGARRDVADILAACDVGVLASHEEGFSNAVIEYMAAGLPVVATDVGGNAEAILDGGIIVPPRTPSALAEALADLQDEPRRRSMGARARQRAADEFSLSKCVDRYDALYTSIAGRGIALSGVAGRDLLSPASDES
jgi:glycosyltransferase involved in cell wall biosynthesis